MLKPWGTDMLPRIYFYSGMGWVYFAYRYSRGLCWNCCPLCYHHSAVVWGHYWSLKTWICSKISYVVLPLGSPFCCTTADVGMPLTELFSFRVSHWFFFFFSWNIYETYFCFCQGFIVQLCFTFKGMSRWNSKLHTHSTCFAELLKSACIQLKVACLPF